MLNVNLCGIELENPLMLAAGILGSHASSMNLVLDAGAGAVVSKSFSKEANDDLDDIVRYISENLNEPNIANNINLQNSFR